MKTKLLALCALLSVASASAQQKFSSLPIGYNLEGYISSIRVFFGTGYDAITDTFRYNSRRDGTLETFAGARIREMANRFVTKPGQETAPHWWSIDAITDGIGGLLPTYNGESKPATIAVAPPAGEQKMGIFYLTLRNGRWEVPEEVFGKVKFQWPWGIPFDIPEMKDQNLEVTLYGAGGRVSRFATRERISDSDNPCKLPAIIDLLRMGVVTIPTEIVIPENPWWNRAEITLLSQAGRVVFEQYYPPSPTDGRAVNWSNSLPSFFVPPTPKIASLKRVGDTTEIVVENTDAPVFEFSSDLVEWHQIGGSEIVLQSINPSVFRHRTGAVNSFYRLRLKDGVQ